MFNVKISLDCIASLQKQCPVTLVQKTLAESMVLFLHIKHKVEKTHIDFGVDGQNVHRMFFACNEIIQGPLLGLWPSVLVDSQTLLIC